MSSVEARVVIYRILQTRTGTSTLPSSYLLMIHIYVCAPVNENARQYSQLVEPRVLRHTVSFWWLSYAHGLGLAGLGAGSEGCTLDGIA